MLMRCQNVAAVACVAILLAGCGKKLPVETASSKPVTLPDASAVLMTLKEDLASYNLYQAAHDNDAPVRNACKGSVSFRIESVALELATVQQSGSGASAGAKVPVAGLQLGPELSTKKTLTSSQKVKLLLVPAQEDPVAVEAKRTDLAPPKRGSFDEALRGLRESLLKASDQKPCFRFPKDQDNSVSSSFQVTIDKEMKFGVSFLIFSLGAVSSSSDDRTSTITIKFQGWGRTVYAADGTVRTRPSAMAAQGGAALSGTLKDSQIPDSFIEMILRQPEPEMPSVPTRIHPQPRPTN